jgi:parvulin-like peptidyl-prolyl isomerase
MILGHWNTLQTTEIPEQPVTEDISGRRLVSFRDGEWTVKDFVSRMERTSERQRRRVQTVEDVKDVVTGLIVREEMLRQAIAMGLDNDPTVREQVGSLSNHHLLTAWRELVIDTIGQAGWSEELLKREFEISKELHQNPPEVNVAEILVRTREEAEGLADKLRSGADFSALAEQHSIRVWAGKRGGELGFGTRGSFGVLGDKFFESPVGALIGPEYVDPYYGLFRILARREGRGKTFTEVRAEVIARLTARMEREVFAAAVKGLRSNAQIKIDESALASIVVENHVKDDAS